MRPLLTVESHPRAAYLIGVVVFAYWALGSLGLAFGAPLQQSAGAIWPPSGLGVAVVLLSGYRYLPVVFLGALLVALQTGAGLPVASGIAMGYGLEVLLAAYLTRRFAGQRVDIHRLRDATGLIVFGAGLSTVAGASAGVASLWAGGMLAAPDPGLWLNWWTGDMVGVLVVAPFLLAFGEPQTHPSRAAWYIEAAAIMLVIAVITGLVFGPGFLFPHRYPLAFLFLPLIVWAAVRYEVRGAAAVTLLLAAVSVHGTARGYGPFTLLPAADGMLLLGLFISVTAITGLLVAASTSERREIGALREELALREGEDRYRIVFEHVPVGVALVNGEQRHLLVNPAWERMTGYTAVELAGGKTLDITHAEDRGASRRFLDEVMRGGHGGAGLEMQFSRRNGEVLWARVHGAVIRDRDGQPGYRLAIIEDIGAEKESAQRQTEMARTQREALVREVHHRIKNTLQGVAGLLERHAAANPALGPAIDEARTRLNALALAHGLESSIATMEINLCNIVRGLVDMLQAVSPAEIKFDLPEGFIPIEVAEEESVPVALILNELLTNAIKHVDAGAGQAAVSVSLGSSGEGAVVVVRNEPARLPAGFDFDSGAGLGTGLKLAKSLLPAQGATLSVGESSPGRVEAVLTLFQPVSDVPPAPKQGGDWM